MQRKTITAQEAADYIGVHIDTIYTMVRQKQIPHVRVRRRILFNRETIDSWMAEQESRNYEEAI
ncbi:helix-turn-helix domain-containing protein [Mesobacillus zeae]|uniref:Helix-turn-helix domain-containing protein n=1 Tax=Mesobacillus zeae TaxID=1917180 RepID=A0A398B675_9BACI|nr:helix-turn-helix domain-containing protein [Mesobacillus zeae]RID85051.1 helix-turn-helix domain-containing protein [Mesobacillus zeae]